MHRAFTDSELDNCYAVFMSVVSYHTASMLEKFLLIGIGESSVVTPLWSLAKLL